MKQMGSSLRVICEVYRLSPLQRQVQDEVFQLSAPD